MWSFGVTALGDGHFISFIILASYPGLPLPIHHEKHTNEQYKLNVNMVDSSKVKKFCLSLWVPDYIWAMSSECPLLLFHSLMHCNTFLQGIEFIKETQVSLFCFLGVFLPSIVSATDVGFYMVEGKR